MDQKKPKFKKKRRGRPLILAVILVALLLVLLFGNQLGLGSGTGLSFLGEAPPDRALPQIDETNTDQSAETEMPPTARQEIILTIAETSIQANGETYTLDAFATYLADSDPNLLFVMKDEQANYQLFKEVEDLLKAENLAYVIED